MGMSGMPGRCERIRAHCGKSPTPRRRLRRVSGNCADRLFSDFGLAKHPFYEARTRYFGELPWSPDIEVLLDNGTFFVHADLPGLTKDDVTIDISDGMLTVTGERKAAEERKREGYYQTERTYGRFCRNIVLPEGTKPETAKATFKNGVLEIAIDVPEPPKPTVRHVVIAE
jgi:HSP20 family protein